MSSDPPNWSRTAIVQTPTWTVRVTLLRRLPLLVVSEGTPTITAGLRSRLDVAFDRMKLGLPRLRIVVDIEERDPRKGSIFERSARLRAALDSGILDHAIVTGILAANGDITVLDHTDTEAL
jgi:hypothetical protein